MGRLHSWQRGTADLIAVAVGTLMMGLAVAGTSMALVYSRDQLVREEHTKVAAYLLRGKMEHQMCLMQTDYQNYLTPQQLAAQPRNDGTVLLDNPFDRDRHVRSVAVRFYQDRIEPVDIQDTGEGYDYYTLTMRARWRENDAPEQPRNQTRMEREIVFTTSVLVQKQL